jgi:hypothetical protein
MRTTSVAKTLLRRVRHRVASSLTTSLQRHALRGRAGELIARFGPEAMRPSPSRPVLLQTAWHEADRTPTTPIVSQLAPCRSDAVGSDAWLFTGNDAGVIVTVGAASVTMPSDELALPVDAAFRPVLFPQRGAGVLELDGPEVRSAASSVELSRAACIMDRVVVATASLDDPEVIHAAIKLSAAGAPLEFSEPLAAGAAPLGPRTTAAVAAPTATTRRAREIRSVRIRRAALTEHGVETRLAQVADRLGVPNPVGQTVSVMLASRRPDDLLGAVDQVNAQVGADIELVVGLHGDQWGRDWEARIREHWNGPLHVLSAPDTTSFGDMLTMLGRATNGDLVTKWDDDDWYGPHHVADLALAHRYSGAELVGKAAEFVYLAGLDRTIRRFATGAESYSETLAGGTLAASRDWLDELGWWPSMSSNIDLHAIRATQRAGGRTYRTHGFEYVLHRGADPTAHTWWASDSYFELTAREHRPGLDLSFAGFGEP